MRDVSGTVPESELAPADTRKARVDRLRAIVERVFPGEERRELRENIERSFAVPQAGDYHNEGMFMDSHLDLIIKNIESVARGEFPEEIGTATREALGRAVRRDSESVRKYVFLHDISKADCLTITKDEGTEHEQKVAITWNEWGNILKKYRFAEMAAELGEEGALRQVLLEAGIYSVSYYQGDGDSKRQHGTVGAEELRAAGDMDETMLAAIEAHEVAYQFEKINVSTYEKYFGEMSAEARDFALLASYVDTMASLRPDGKPDLSNFLALAGSREKSESLAVLAGKLAGAKLDKQKFARAWPALLNSSEPLPLDMIAATEERLRAECKLAGYDVEKLRTYIEPLVANEILTADERDRVLAMAVSDPQGIPRAFAPKMRFIGPVLRQAQI